MMTNKKGTPEGAPSETHKDDITSKCKSEAEALFDRIGTGKRNAVARPKGKTDRLLRRLISEANRSGDCVINSGSGYYRPDKEDEEELKRYLWAELHRAQVIEDKVQSMREAYYGRY